MRLLHCIPTLAGGGAERQVALLSGAQVRQGHDVHVCTVGGGPNAEAVRAGGASLHQLACRGSYDPRLILQLRQLLRTIRPDLVQTWLTQMDVAGGIAARLTGVPWLLSERTASVFFTGTAKGWLRERIACEVNAVVANSADGAAYWRARHPETPVHVIPNAVPHAAIDAAPVGTADDPRPLILYAGRFSPEKNATALVEALAVAARETSFVALLCGEGPEAGTIRQLIDSRGLADRILLSGYRDDLWSLMKRAAIFVSLSHFEGQPNAVLEAMVCGCPLLLSDIRPHLDLAGGGAGWLVPPDDVASGARLLVTILRDPAEGRRRGQVARLRALDFTPEACASAYHGVYSSVLAHRR